MNNINKGDMEMTESNNKFFEDSSNIRVVQLSDWLSWACGDECTPYRVSLPIIQRGFVWKPNQIIELWDTLLRGMPIGSLMISEKSGDSVNLMSRELQESGERDLGLIDGQQRTLAMLVGWLSPEREDCSHRLWVDFADESSQGQLLRLRVTTRNQPFGFQRNNPNAKLSLNEKYRAKQLFHGGQLPEKASPEKLKEQQIDYFLRGFPFVSASHPHIVVDMRVLVQFWREAKGVRSEWQAKVMEVIERITIATEKENNTYARLTSDQKEMVQHRVGLLATGFEQLFAAEIALLRVGDAVFESNDSVNDDPPLAVLFKRIGSNATPLANADYIFSILKHRKKELHTMVNKLHGENHAASLLSATDLVMSAFRLAVADAEETDYADPDKNTFHRLLPKIDSKDKKTTEEKTNLDKVLDAIGGYFEVIKVVLSYDKGTNPNGLPVHSFPHLKRPLVQVLLRMVQVGYLSVEKYEERRADVLRLVLYWMQWVTDAQKASLIAFTEIKNWSEVANSNELGKEIYRKIVEGKRGVKIFSPGKIEDFKLSKTDVEKPIRGWSRFQLVNAEDREVLESYRYWWKPESYHHPILLWLQRSYVATQPWSDPMAGNEEDTPYDYDHILPRVHWSDGRSNNILDFCVKDEWRPHIVIGNSIGNVRVWDSSGNRSDGADSPKIKAGKDDDIKNWFESSLIDDAGIGNIYWFGSPADEKEYWVWDATRAAAFQEAVERRSFNLYQELFEKAGFEGWIN